MSLNIQKIPVFVFPSSIKFFLGSRSSYKQLLTLYNPYDFSVRFKVLSTAPNKYTVIDPDGSIGPQSCVDIVIRHVKPISANCNVTDKFRISMLDYTTKKLLGKRDLEATLFDGEKDTGSIDGDQFQSLGTSVEGGSERKMQHLEHFPQNRPLRQNHSQSSMYLILVMSLVAIGILCLPTRHDKVQETVSIVPVYLHMSTESKLAAAYALGIFTIAILRPYYN